MTMCGIIGLRNSEEVVTPQIYYGLISLQHRGSESSGISIFDGQKIITHRGMGLVRNVLTKAILSKIQGNVGIGHCRYSTAGKSSISDAQPMQARVNGCCKFSIAFNGTISNYQKLRKDLINQGLSFKTMTDTEVLLRLLNIELSKKDIPDSIESVMQRLDGAYSVIMVTDEGKLVGFRDPLGFKPLCFNNDGFSSENVTFDSLEAKDVVPGECIVISDEVKRYQIQSSERHAHCQFEWVYFARPDSILEGKEVYQVRERLGRILAKEHPIEADLITSIPDGGRPAAMGYSLESGIPYIECIAKNGFSGRSFILPRQKEREEIVRSKLNPIKSVVKGKRIIIVDDSIVRGTTTAHVIKSMREAGAKDVFLCVSCPPIRFPCYAGIDFPSRKELIAGTRTISETQQKLGVDLLIYQSIEGLVEGISLPRNELCLACLTGEYPMREKPTIYEERFEER